MSELKKTPLYDFYQSTGAKLIDFGGYLLPVQISGIKQEHQAVRTHAGLFDVSHMGEFFLEGTGAEPFLQRMVTNNVKQAKIGDALYTAMCYEDGGTVDDLLIYHLAENRYMLVVNAANIEKDFDWLRSHLDLDSVQLVNRSEEMALLAIQGPLAETILQKLAAERLQTIDRFTFKENILLNGRPALVSRTGYTGEDGFEIYCAAESARKIWDDLLEAGKEEGLVPCGLGARDTLRFEARLPLYGQELSRAISPLEAGIGFAVKLNIDEDFIGKQALIKQKQTGLRRRIVGIEMIDRAIPRTHYAVFAGEQKIGEVTTGTQSPTLGKNLGLALVAIDYSKLGTLVEVDIRGKRKQAKVIKTPFYKKA
ncbi:MAG: glycine cleavage system aminomethyltransferase GcvT [Sporolactobacillus sp.]